MRTRAVLLPIAALALASAFFSDAADARCGGAVTVYAAHWCPYCAKTERFLSSRGVRYRRVEVSENRNVQSLMRRRFGTTAVPVVAVDGDFAVGHDEAWLRRTLCLR